MAVKFLILASILATACGGCGTEPAGGNNTNAAVNVAPNMDPGDVGTNLESPDAAGNTDPWHDDDGDGLPSQFDNCPTIANDDQADADADGVGDVCDNCPDAANLDQADEDADGSGDACEDEPAGEICGTQQNEFELVKPNIYIVVDRSTSMQNLDGTGMTRMVRARAGLDQIGMNSADSVRFGLSVYPCANENDACNMLNQELLPMGSYTTAEFQTSYSANYTAATCPHQHQARYPLIVEQQCSLWPDRVL